MLQFDVRSLITFYLPTRAHGQSQSALHYMMV